MAGWAGANWQLNSMSAVLMFSCGMSSTSSPESLPSTGKLCSSNFCQDHLYHVSGAFLGHSQSNQGSLLSNRGEWKTQCGKNGLASRVAMSSGVDKYMRACSRSSGSSRTLDEALLGRLSLLEPVGGGGGAGSLSLRKNQSVYLMKMMKCQQSVTYSVFLLVSIAHAGCCQWYVKHLHAVQRQRAYEYDMFW